VLAGCPDGATTKALQGVGVNVKKLPALVRKKLVRAHMQRIIVQWKPSGEMIVPRFHLTDAGREIVSMRQLYKLSVSKETKR
jgi:hypothetical protein